MIRDVMEKISFYTNGATYKMLAIATVFCYTESSSDQDFYKLYGKRYEESLPISYALDIFRYTRGSLWYWRRTLLSPVSYENLTVDQIKSNPEFPWDFNDIIFHNPSKEVVSWLYNHGYKTKKRAKFSYRMN
jgi:hypothetical protein